MPRGVLPPSTDGSVLNIELGLCILGEESGQSAVRQEVSLLITMNDIDSSIRYNVVPTPTPFFAELTSVLYDLVPITVAHVHNVRHRVPPFVK